MKKFLAGLMFLLCGVSVAHAQAEFKRSLANHVGVNVSVGTQGLGVGVAVPLTNYVEVSAGLHYLPPFKFNTDATLAAFRSGNITIPASELQIQVDTKRTSFDFNVNVYPFGGGVPFFIGGGLSVGGGQFLTLNAHNAVVEDMIKKYPEIQNQIMAELDEYNLRFDNHGNINAYAKFSNVRPYVGLGFGRLIPRHRVGFRAELGCQFVGNTNLYQNGMKVDLNNAQHGDENSVAKIVNKISVYPVLKFALVGRIL